MSRRPTRLTRTDPLFPYTTRIRSGNSAVALSVMNIAEAKQRMTMVTGAGATRITNEECKATNVHWVYDTYALAKVGTMPLVESGTKTWYFITADYSFGHSLENDGSRFIKEAGGKVLGSSRYAFPGTDFASFLLSAQSRGAQGVALARDRKSTSLNSSH